ncbi:MAG: ABC transporter permease, partial [Methanosarcinales archaeon]
MVDLIESIKMAIDSIKSAKLRSSLTTLGVIIGVAAVIANVSIGAGFSAFFTDEILKLGSNAIYISAQEPNLLQYNELKLVRNTPGVMEAAPLKGRTAEVRYMFESKPITVFGTTKDYKKVGNLNIESGNFLKDNDQYVAVIGYKVASDKFSRNISNRNPIELTFKLRDGSKITKKFVVKGIIHNPDFQLGGGEGGIPSNNAVIIPIDTLNQILDENDYGMIFASAKSLEAIKPTSEELDKRMARAIGISKKDLNDEDAKPYNILTQLDFIEQTAEWTNALSSILLAVALISLIVGSIGIMNIMLVTVTERTREVGVMKSLGATDFDILSTFLVEAAFIGLIGGLLGVALGYFGGSGAQNIINLPNVFPIEWVGIGLG